jgi:hypothetical protein
MPLSLIHCIYASAAARPFSTSDLAELLRSSRERNARLGLTGMLLYAEGSFLQVLEGAGASVDALVGKIEADPRHEQVTVIIREPIARRAFSDWSMGFYAATRSELDGIAGVNDFFGGARTLAQVDAGRAQKLLAGFRDGRWRKKALALPQEAAA